MEIQYQPFQKPQIQSHSEVFTMNDNHYSNFQKWLLRHEPTDVMTYKRAWWDTYIFIRDIIIPIFDTHKDEYKDYHGDEYFRAKNNSLNSFTHVVGAHISKSLDHPVIKLDYKGVSIIFRYNFYDYEIAVIGNVPMVFPEEIYYSSGYSFFYQGFPEEYMITEKYSPNASTFVIGANNHYQFYSMMVIIRATIDAYRKKEDDHYVHW